MQKPKEEIRNRILLAAKEEFLEKGFEKASVRSITAKAHTSKSNVYNYFRDKDALFHAVVEPTLMGMKQGLKWIRNENREKRESYSIAAQKKVICIIMDFVYTNKDDFRLLLFRAAGSSLAGFKALVLDGLSAALTDWVKVMAPEKEISELLVRSVAGFYVGAIEGLLLVGKTKEQAAAHLDEFLRFVYGGWNAVLSDDKFNEKE